jgi:putative ABC transport system permease protein
MQKLKFLLQLWAWFSLRHMATHKGRALTVLLGVALGAAVFTCVRLAVDASLQSFTKSVDSISGKAQWVLIRPGGRIQETCIADLLRNPAVKAVSPLLMTYVQMQGHESAPFLLLGFDPMLDSTLRDWESGATGSDSPASSRMELLTEPYTLLMGAPLASTLGLDPGSSATLRHVRNRHSFRVSAILAEEGMALAEGGEIALADISTFQEFTTTFGEVDRIDIIFKENVTESEIQGFKDALPAGLVLEQAGEIRASGTNLIRSYQLNLSILSFVSLFVGMFLVYSLITLNATARRHEIAVLRSLGASARCIMFLYLVEGAFFGLGGWLLAIPLGTLLIHRLVDNISATISLLFVRVPAETLVLAPRELILSFSITILVSVLASCQPAVEAMRVPPRESMIMFSSGSDGQGSGLGLALLGVILTVTVWPLSRIQSVAGIPLFGYLATFVLFVGFALLSPWLLHAIGSVLPGLLLKVGGQPAFLGARYVRDAGKRAAISVGALITAVALFIALTIMIHSFRETVETWVSQSISGDLFLGPRMAAINHYKDTVPEELVVFLKGRQPPLDLVPYRRIALRHEQRDYQFEAIDFEKFLQHASFLMLDGSLEEVLPQLIRGEGFLISEVFSGQASVSRGKRFRLIIEGVELDLPVLGIFRDYRTRGGVVHFSLPVFEELTGIGSWSGVRVHLTGLDSHDEQKMAKLRNSLLEFCMNQGFHMDVTLGRDLRNEILRIFDETFAVTGVLLVIALVVASLGITSTLTVLVLERSHQLHTLLAIGAHKGQIRTMILWEAVLMVTAGEVLGSVCGFVLSLLLIFVINKQSFGWTFIYSVNWPGIMSSLPLILTTAVVASVPAVRLVFSRISAVVLREK